MNNSLISSRYVILNLNRFSKIVLQKKKKKFLIDPSTSSAAEFWEDRQGTRKELALANVEM